LGWGQILVPVQLSNVCVLVPSLYSRKTAASNPSPRNVFYSLPERMLEAKNHHGASSVVKAEM